MSSQEMKMMWGAATSAYQIEGAASEDGKGLSIWDTFVKIPGKIQDHSTGNMACDHYHRFKEDIAIMAGMGLQTYRFSVSWPRIFPNGKGKLNQAGLDFYEQLIDTLLHHGIQPHVTLYHWDLPEALEKNGGWLERDTCTYFAEYAAQMVSQLGDRVPFFTTINEPATVMMHGYITGKHAPGKQNIRAALLAGHHLLLAHGKAMTGMRAVNAKCKIGLVNCFQPVYDYPGAPMRVKGILHAMMNRLFMDPVYLQKYPAPLNTVLNALTKQQLKKDLQEIAQPIDFLGVNYYTPVIKRVAAVGRQHKGLPEPLPGKTDMDWWIYPRGLEDILKWLDQTYRKPMMHITENGAAFQSVGIHDQVRIDFLKTHIQAVYNAMQSGVKVQNFYVWSLLDNFEWRFGYTKQFGLVQVDFKTQKRTMKESAFWYREFIKKRGVLI